MFERPSRVMTLRARTGWSWISGAIRARPPRLSRRCRGWAVARWRWATTKALTASEHLGAPMPSTAGHPVLLFFWAHWCPDCKAEAPIIAELQATYRNQGLIVIGPTRRYGYAAGGVDATPAEELAHIEKVRQQYYGTIKDMAVPVSDEDALGYGMDATPTLVLVDRQGKVALYHPGAMTREQLEPYLKTLVATPQ